jgi:hypothetical protein
METLASTRLSPERPPVAILRGAAQYSRGEKMIQRVFAAQKPQKAAAPRVFG